MKTVSQELPKAWEFFHALESQKDIQKLQIYYQGHADHVED
jgi:hypothetical protein